MRCRPFLSALAALYLTTAAASAKIGETRAQIEARMGTPALVRQNAVEYSKGGYMVAVVYRDGLSVAEVVTKVPGATDQTAAFSESELAAVLAAYAAGSLWDRDPAKEAWLRADKKVVAAREGDGKLFFADAQFAGGLVSKRDADEKARIDSVFGPAASPEAGQWAAPLPPYPEQARASHVTGTTTVRCITDAVGNVSSAVIVKSTGAAILDSNTLGWIKAKWHGPANVTHEAEFSYTLK